MTISFPSLLGLVFLILKLTGVIHWNWLWVLSPFWIPLAIMFALCGIWLVLVLLKAWAESAEDKTKTKRRVFFDV